MGNKNDRLFEIARTGKVHGLDGTVRLHPSEGAEAFIETGSLLYLENRRGDLIPARITDLRLEEKRNARLFFVKFDRISDRSQAELFQDTPVYADRDTVRTESEPAGESFTGFKVRDETGIVGVVESLIPNPAHPLIRVVTDKTGGAGIILIPWVDEYVVAVDEKNQTLTCRNLDPLKDL